MTPQCTWQLQADGGLNEEKKEGSLDIEFYMSLDGNKHGRAM